MRVQALHPIVAGNSRVTLVAAVAPAASAYLDTCNTLRLAVRSQAITTRMLRNPSMGPLLDIPPAWDALPPEVRAGACVAGCVLGFTWVNLDVLRYGDGL